MSQKMMALVLGCMISMAAWSKPVVEIVVGTRAGGIMDLNARQLQNKLSEIDTTRTYIVINKPGAGGMIAYDYAMRSEKPALAMISVGTFSELALKKSFDEIVKEAHFMPPVWRSPGVLGISVKSGISDLDEFVARGRSGRLTCGAAATSIALALQYYVDEMKFKDTAIVQFKGTADGIALVHNGEIDCWLDAYHGPVAQAQNNGQIKLIASSQPDTHASTTGLPKMQKHLPQDTNFLYSWWGTVGISNNDSAFQKDIIPVLVRATALMESTRVADVSASDTISPTFFKDQARIVNKMAARVNKKSPTALSQ